MKTTFSQLFYSCRFRVQYFWVTDVRSWIDISNKKNHEIYVPRLDVKMLLHYINVVCFLDRFQNIWRLSSSTPHLLEHVQYWPSYKSTMYSLVGTFSNLNICNIPLVGSEEFSRMSTGGYMFTFEQKFIEQLSGIPRSQSRYITSLLECDYSFWCF